VEFFRRTAKKASVKIQQRMEKAYGKWLVGTTGIDSALDYIMQKTHVSEEEVWNFLKGRRT
jgi:hypothetical protein